MCDGRAESVSLIADTPKRDVKCVDRRAGPVT
jgi:hypothetical protein